MSRLFWKIFAWFWGAMIALLLVMVALEWLIPLEPQGVTQRALLTRALEDAAGRAAYEMEIGGQAALERELEKFENEADVQAFWLTAKGEEPPETSLAAPVATTIVSEIARQAGARPKGSNAVWRVVGFQVYSAVKVPGYNNVLVIRFDRHPLSARFSSQLTRLLAIICTAGVVCWLLSHYLVAPIEALRAASRQLADGNFTARVTPALPLSRRDEIALLSRDFDRMAGQLQALVTAQGRLLGDVSHELRTPLTRLRLALALFERDAAQTANAPQETAHRRRMEQEIAALDSLIDELLILSRLENRLEAPGHLSTFDGVERLREVAAKIEWDAGQQNHGVIVQVQCELTSLTLPGEAALFCRALENIARNALRYSPPGGEIVFHLWSEGNLAVVTITDEGPGVPTEELEAIFQPFHRVEGQAKQSGTGLGLAIARRAALLHGGTLHASNRTPHGLELRLEWPQQQNLDFRA